MSKLLVKSDYTFPAINHTIKKGLYEIQEIKSLLGNSFEFIVNCTNFKDIIETPEDNLVVENLEQSNEIETQNIENIETPEDNLVVETKIKPNKKSSKK